MKLKKQEPISGNNPIGLADLAAKQAGETKTSKSSLSVANSLHRLGENQIPTALEYDPTKNAAWEREKSLGRGLKEAQKHGGNMAVRVRVKSNSHRGKTEVIDDVILHFDNDGWATIPAGEAYKIEAFAAKRPGRMTVVREEVTTAEDLLAAAKAAMAKHAPVAPVEEPPVQYEVVQVPPSVEVPTEQQAAAELGLDMTQVEEEEAVPPPVKESKPKKANKKE
jgi:hypothetical protein